MASGTGEHYLCHGWAHTDPSNSDNLDGDGGGWACACARARECVRVCFYVCVCVRACVRACVMCLPYTIILFTQADNDNN